MKRLLIALLCLSFQYSAFACINEIRMKMNGESYESHGGVEFLPYHRSLKDSSTIKYYTEKKEEYYQSWKQTRNLDDYSDYGAMLIYLGEYKKAEAIFLEIESKEPGRYATAANIGTLYELLGENELALRWIRKAVKINPEAHEHSEWLHVKILEAKIGGTEYMTAHFLTGVDFGADSIPHTKMDTVALKRLRDEIYFQLSERMTFIKPEDKIIGLLLFQLGNVMAITNDITTSLRIYDLAIAYGYASEVLDKRYYKFKLIHNPSYTNKNKHISTRAEKNRVLEDHTVVVKPSSVMKEIYLYWLFGGVLAATCLYMALYWYIKRGNNE